MDCVLEKETLRIAYDDRFIRNRAVYPEWSDHELRIQTAIDLRPQFRLNREAGLREQSGLPEYDVPEAEFTLTEAGSVYYVKYGQNLTDLHERQKRLTPDTYSSEEHAISVLIEEHFRNGATSVITSYGERDLIVMRYDPVTKVGTTAIINTDSAQDKPKTVKEMAKTQFSHLEKLDITENIFIYSDRILSLEKAIVFVSPYIEITPVCLLSNNSIKDHEVIFDESAIFYHQNYPVGSVASIEQTLFDTQRNPQIYQLSSLPLDAQVIAGRSVFSFPDINKVAMEKIIVKPLSPISRPSVFQVKPEQSVRTIEGIIYDNKANQTSGLIGFQSDNGNQIIPTVINQVSTPACEENDFMRIAKITDGFGDLNNQDAYPINDRPQTGQLITPNNRADYPINESQGASLIQKDEIELGEKSAVKATEFTCDRDRHDVDSHNEVPFGEIQFLTQRESIGLSLALIVTVKSKAEKITIPSQYRKPTSHLVFAAYSGRNKLENVNLPQRQNIPNDRFSDSQSVRGFMFRQAETMDTPIVNSGSVLQLKQQERRRIRQDSASLSSFWDKDTNVNTTSVMQTDYEEINEYLSVNDRFVSQSAVVDPIFLTAYEVNSIGMQEIGKPTTAHGQHTGDIGIPILNAFNFIWAVKRNGEYVISEKTEITQSTNQRMQALLHFLRKLVRKYCGEDKIRQRTIQHIHADKTPMNESMIEEISEYVSLLKAKINYGRLFATLHS
jgi:hypothetical protein